MIRNGYILIYNTITSVCVFVRQRERGKEREKSIGENLTGLISTCL